MQYTDPFLSMVGQLAPNLADSAAAAVEGTGTTRPHRWTVTLCWWSEPATDVEPVGSMEVAGFEHYREALHFWAAETRDSDRPDAELLDEFGVVVRASVAVCFNTVSQAPPIPGFYRWNEVTESWDRKF